VELPKRAFFRRAAFYKKIVKTITISIGNDEKLLFALLISKLKVRRGILSCYFL